MGAIDAFYCDCKHAIFGSTYPPFFFQIPDMELQMLSGAGQQAFDFEIADAGIARVLPALHIKHRKQLVLNVGVPFDALTIARFLGQSPAEARTVFLLNIELCAFDRISERIM